MAFSLFSARLALGIRWRLTLWYVLILCLVLVAFSGIVYATQANSIHSSLNGELASEAGNLASSYDPSNGQFDLNVTTKSILAGSVVSTPAATMDEQQLVALKKSGQLATTSNNGDSSPLTGVTAEDSATLMALGKGGVALLVDPSGRVLTHYGRLSDSDATRLRGQIEPVGPPRVGTSTFTQQIHANSKVSKSVTYRFFTTPVLMKDVVAGTLIVGVPDRAPAQLHRLLMTLLIAAPITLLIAAVGGFWLASRAMRPVQLIAGTARSIGATDLSQRLNLPNRDEIGELAATFDQMLDRLESAFQRQRQFTSDASHELRTPLTIVQLELEHARLSPSITPQIVRALDTIRSENEHMSRLVNDLLMLARADDGRAVLTYERLDLSDVALSAVERLEPLAHESGITLRVGDLPELAVRGDEGYLTQMLTNVIENGIRYTSGHGHSVTVESSSSRDEREHRAWVRISDDGPGIPDEHLPHLFERFYRVDQARSAGHDDRRSASATGSGLGLSIVRWVAETHGGDVLVESEVGEGTTFTIWLPLAPEQQPQLGETLDVPMLAKAN